MEGALLSRWGVGGQVTGMSVRRAAGWLAVVVSPGMSMVMVSCPVSGQITGRRKGVPGASLAAFWVVKGR